MEKFLSEKIFIQTKLVGKTIFVRKKFIGRKFYWEKILENFFYQKVLGVMSVT